MNLLGIRLTLLIGPTIAVPAPAFLTEALDSVEVTHSDDKRSGFEINFRVGRSGALDLLGGALLSSPLLKAFNRVILVITFNATPRVLIDGVITQSEYSPSNEPGASTLTLKGEDISRMMDMDETSAEHPGQDDTIIALKLIASYAQYGLIPIVIPPPVIDPPLLIERVPGQQLTDLRHLKRMARRHGYVFYITPGPLPFTNTAYWGPPIRVGVPQPALTVNMGPSTNVDEMIHFRSDALVPTNVSGYIQDRLTNKSIPVKTFASLRVPLATLPAWLVNLPNVRKTQFRESGLNVMQAYGRAQGRKEAADEVVTASGELDALRYGSLLQPRGLVGLRGAGYLYDGFWYVKSVTHTIRREEYKQRFTLAREGLGSTTPVVMP